MFMCKLNGEVLVLIPVFRLFLGPCTNGLKITNKYARAAHAYTVSPGIQKFLGQCTNGLQGTNNYASHGAAHAYKSRYSDIFGTVYQRT